MFDSVNSILRRTTSVYIRKTREINIAIHIKKKTVEKFKKKLGNYLPCEQKTEN